MIIACPNCGRPTPRLLCTACSNPRHVVFPTPKSEPPLESSTLFPKADPDPRMPKL